MSEVTAHDRRDDAAQYPVQGRRLIGRAIPPIRELLGGLAVPGFGVRPVDPDSADVDLIHAWMNCDEVAAGWEQAWPRERWRDHLVDQLAGDYSLPMLVSDVRGDFAYVELYRAHGDVVALHYDSDPHDVGFHIAIGVAEHRGTGRGPQVGVGFVDAVFRADPRCLRIISDPDVRNRAAVRVDEMLGLRALRTVRLPHKTAALFAAERSWLEAFRRRGTEDRS